MESDQMASHWCHGKEALPYMDATIVDTLELAVSYVQIGSTASADAANAAATRKQTHQV